MAIKEYSLGYEIKGFKGFHNLSRFRFDIKAIFKSNYLIIHRTYTGASIFLNRNAQEKLYNILKKKFEK